MVDTNSDKNFNIEFENSQDNTEIVNSIEEMTKSTDIENLGQDEIIKVNSELKDLENDINTNKNDSNSANDLENDENPKNQGQNQMDTEILDEVMIKQEIDEFDAYADDDRVYRKYRLRDKKEKTRIKEDIDKYDEEPNNDDLFTCPHCHKKFDSKTGLLNHIRTHQVIRKFICPICKDVFESNAKLVDHKKIHEDENQNFTCTKCSLAFSSHCDYAVHQVQHMHNLKCEQCSVYYKQRYLLENHIRTHYNIMLECDICYGKFNGEARLKQHLINHQNEKKCVECGKIISVSMFKYHMATHTGVKRYQCLYCGVGFINACQRNVHTRIHTNERPYKCDICHTAFKQSGDLKKHKITHKVVKDFQCDYCKKKFFLKQSLMFHIRKHTKSKLFQCPECDHTSVNRGSLRTHILYKHTEKGSFKCEVCDLDFKMSSALKRHNRSIKHKNLMYGKLKKEEVVSD